MKRVRSFSWRARFQPISMYKAIGIATGCGIFVTALAILAISVVCIQNQHYFLSLVTLVLSIAVAKVGVEFFNEVRNQKISEAGASGSKSKWVDSGEDDEDEGENWKKEVYKPVVSRIIDPKKKRMLKGGRLGYKPVEELDLPAPALNFVVATFSCPKPDSDAMSANSNTTPE